MFTNFTTIEDIDNIKQEHKTYYAAVGNFIMKYYQVRKNRKHTKITRYSNSTDDKRSFHAWMVHAWFTKRNITASMIAIEMAVSRKSVDKWVNDWLAEGWLVKETCKETNKIYLRATFEPLITSMEFFDWHQEVIAPMMKDAYQAYMITDVEAQKQRMNTVAFQPVETANMRGIEQVTTDFIINPSKRNRKVAKN